MQKGVYENNDKFLNRLLIQLPNLKIQDCGEKHPEQIGKHKKGCWLTYHTKPFHRQYDQDQKRQDDEEGCQRVL